MATIDKQAVREQIDEMVAKYRTPTRISSGRKQQQQQQHQSSPTITASVLSASASSINNSNNNSNSYAKIQGYSIDSHRGRSPTRGGGMDRILDELVQENNKLGAKLQRSRESNIQLREELSLSKKQKELLLKSTEKLKREKTISDIGFTRSYAMDQSQRVAAKRQLALKRVVTETVQEKIVGLEDTVQAQGDLIDIQEDELRTLHQQLTSEAEKSVAYHQRCELFESSIAELSALYQNRNEELAQENLCLKIKSKEDYSVISTMSAISSILQSISVPSSMSPTGGRISQEITIQALDLIEQFKKSKNAKNLPSPPGSPLFFDSPPKSPSAYRQQLRQQHQQQQQQQLSSSTIDMMNLLQLPIPRDSARKDGRKGEEDSDDGVGGGTPSVGDVAVETIEKLVRFLHVEVGLIESKFKELDMKYQMRLRDMELTIENQRSSNNELLEKESDMQKELSRSQRQVEDSKYDLTKEMAKLNVMKKENETLLQKVEALEAKAGMIPMLEKMLKEEKEKNDKLKDDILVLNSQLEQLRNTLDSRSRQVLECREETEKTKNEMKDLRSSREVLQTAALRSQNELENIITALERRLMDAESSRDAVLNDVTRTRHKLAIAEEQRDELLKQIRESDKNWQSVQGALWSLAR